MINQKNKFYVTTPIYYVTARPHLGSLYSTLLADIIARWQKLLGKKTFLLTGTDEHGQKVAQAAQKANKSPQEFVDSFIPTYKSVWHEYEIAYNYFIRTTDPHHIKAVQQWIKKLEEKGDIYKDNYHGWYCTPCETFITEKHGEIVSNPVCPSCGRASVLVSEETYFFKLSAYQDKLLQFYQENPHFIIPKERAHEVINFVKSGLKDLSISRTTVQWGIPFPGDPAHTTYVWADALNNYITAIGYGQPNHEKEFNFWWPADVQIMGKDIVRFHAIYWPAFLMASGLELPKQLLVHGWIKVNEQKMSKSLGNVIDPEELYKKYGPEPVRFYLAKYMAINQDGEFSISDLEQKITSDLANDLGNLLNRVITLAHKYSIYDIASPVVWSEKSVDLRGNCWNMIQEFQDSMENYQFHMALAGLWKFINQVNAFFHEHEPWKVAAHDKEKFNEIISATCHCLHAIGILLWPVMPSKMEQLLNALGISLTMQENKNYIIGLGDDIWKGSFMLHKIPNLFEKIEPTVDNTIQEKSSQPQQPAEPEIAIEDFTKVKLMVGTIEDAQEVQGSDKLLKLQVDFGDLGKRQILSGVKKSYTPDDLKNKQGVFVVNLKPRKMMGFESHGMMLFAAISDGSVFITPSKQIPNGTKVQ